MRSAANSSVKMAKVSRYKWTGIEIACTTRVRKTKVRTTPVRMPTVRKGQQCDETRVRMSMVRMPAVRCDIGAKKVRQQCE